MRCRSTGSQKNSPKIKKKRPESNRNSNSQKANTADKQQKTNKHCHWEWEWEALALLPIFIPILCVLSCVSCPVLSCLLFVLPEEYNNQFVSTFIMLCKQSPELTIFCQKQFRNGAEVASLRGEGCLFFFK